MTIKISTVFTSNGWETTVVMPDGKKVTKKMAREGTGCFIGTTPGSWEDEGLPEAVVEEIDRIDGISLSNHLLNQ